MNILVTMIKLNTQIDRDISFHPFYTTTFHSVCTRYHVTTPFIQYFIVLTLPFHLVTLHAPLRQLISTAHTLDCCALLHIQVSDLYRNVGKRILFLKPLFTSMDIYFYHNLCKWSMTHLPFTALLFLLSLQVCMSSQILKPLPFSLLKLSHTFLLLVHSPYKVY